MTSTPQLLKIGLAGDAAAGLAVATVSVPIVLAYANLTGLPAQAGLYSAILPAIAYAIVGSSRIIVGPDTATCILIGATLTQLGSSGTGDRGLDAALLAFLVGVFCLAGSLLRLGNIANLLSKPILSGYLIGIAASLFVGQYRNLTGVRIVSDGIIPPTIELIGKLGQIHLPTLTVGLSLFITARLLKHIVPGLPTAVAVLIFGILLSWLFGLQAAGLAVVGNIRLGLPSFPKDVSVPHITPRLIDALGIAVVSFSGGIMTARSFAAQLNDPIEPNRVLRGFGVANIAAALGMGYPISGADTRTAVSISAGGRTRWVSIFAAAALVLLTLVLHRPLSILPMAALGAILASAAVDLMDLKGLWHLRHVSYVELALGLLTAVTVVWLDVMDGIIIAIGASLIHVLWYAAAPKDAMQGFIAGMPGVYDLARHKEAEPIPATLVYMFEGSLLFFNASWFGQRARHALDNYPHQVRWFLLNARMMASIDSTGQDELLAFTADLRKRNITLVLAGGGDRFREIVARSGLADAIGRENVFETVSAALFALRLDPPFIASAGPPAQSLAGSKSQQS